MMTSISLKLNWMTLNTYIDISRHPTAPGTQRNSRTLTPKHRPYTPIGPKPKTLKTLKTSLSTLSLSLFKPSNSQPPLAELLRSWRPLHCRPWRFAKCPLLSRFGGYGGFGGLEAAEHIKSQHAIMRHASKISTWGGWLCGGRGSGGVRFVIQKPNPQTLHRPHNRSGAADADASSLPWVHAGFERHYRKHPK